MDWPKLDKLIVYYNGEKGNVVFGKMIYHFTDDDMEREKIIDASEILLAKERIAKMHHLSLDTLEGSSVYELKDIHDYDEKRNLVKVKNIQVPERIMGIFYSKFKIYPLSSKLFIWYKDETAENQLDECSLVKYFNYNNAKLSTREMIYNYGRIDNIIYRLTHQHYDKLTKSDIFYLKEYLCWVGRVNNDKDDDYFYLHFDKFGDNIDKSLDLLVRIEELYNLVHINDKHKLNFLMFALSLISGGDDLVKYEDYTNYYLASFLESYEYNRFSDLLKLMFLTQIKETLLVLDVDFSNYPYPIYSFDSTNFDKDVWVNILEDKINKVVANICNNIGR